MDSATTRRAMEIFEDAIELDPAEREPWLKEVCANDVALYREVERLLACDDGAGRFLPSRLDYLSGSASDPDLTPRLVGKTIGAYQVTSVIATGGMGVVYEAVQRDPPRTVALKVLRRGIASRSALGRFHYEARLLGSLRHPGIAQIFEAGVHDDGSGGVPYFAMEYVPGARHILAYANEEQLGTRDRLRLFAEVCDAVNHGHQKGIIHRDLKPANILVDSSGQTKVIDFGVAKATDSDLALTTRRTEVGELVGTLQYMSPEQCDADPHDLDIRSDVYSLGVVLYELLTGRLPYDVSSSSIYQAPTTIKEAVPPRLSSIKPKLRGDVETIVLKALEKERDRRYDSAADLARDIRRHLDWEPISARPASLSYKLARYVRRRRWQAASIGAVSLALVATGVIAIVTHFLFEARAAQTAEARQRELAQIHAYGQRNAAIETALSINDVGTARKLLDRADTALRGWEWSFLTNGLDHSRLTLAPSGTTGFADIAWSPGSRWLGATSNTALEGMLRLWDGASLRDGRTPVAATEIVVPTSALGTVAFSPDGRSVAATVDPHPGGGRHIRIWDAQTGGQLADLSVGASAAGPLAYSPDGRRLVAGTGDGQIHVWDTSAWEHLATLSGHDRDVLCLAVSPNGKTLASGSSDCSIRIWDLDGPPGFRHVTTLMGHEDHITALAFQPGSGRFLASASVDGSIKLWDSTGISGETTGFETAARRVAPETLSTRAGWVRTLDFSPDGRYLASGGSDRVIRVWTMEAVHPLAERRAPMQGWPLPKLRKLRLLRGHEYPIAHVVFSPQGDSLASLDQGGTIKLWHAGGDSGIPTLEGFMNSVFAVQFSPHDPRIIASRDGEGHVQFWDVQRCEQLFGFRTKWVSGRTVALHPTRAWCAVASHDQGFGAVEVWDYQHRRQLHVLECGIDVRSIAFSPDGALLAWGDTAPDGDEGEQDSTVYLWSIATQRPVTVGRHDGHITAVAFSVDGAWLASAAADGALKVWDIDSGALIQRLTGHSGTVRDIAFDPQGRWIASASDDESIILWDAAGGQLLRRLEGHSARVNSIAFSPEGDRLVSGSMDKTLKLWDPETGIHLATLRDHVGRVYGVAWSPDGQRIASSGSGWSGAGNTVKLWEVRTPVDVLESRAQANLDRDLVFGHVETLFNELFFAERVTAAISADTWFDSHGDDAGRLRDVAIQLAQVQGANRWRQLAGCWQAAQSPQQSVEIYRQAEGIAKLEFDRFRGQPGEQSVRAHTIYGMALYRLDRWDEALDVLEAALQINRNNDTALAFLAMCRHRLGDTDEARATLLTLRDLLARPAHAASAGARETIDEAERLIEDTLAAGSSASGG